MKYVFVFYAYVAIGNILVIQSCIRGWKYRPLKHLEDWATAIGAIFLWPIIVAVELRELWLRRKT